MCGLFDTSVMAGRYLLFAGIVSAAIRTIRRSITASRAVMVSAMTRRSRLAQFGSVAVRRTWLSWVSCIWATCATAMSSRYPVVPERSSADARRAQPRSCSSDRTVLIVGDDGGSGY